MRKLFILLCFLPLLFLNQESGATITRKAADEITVKYGHKVGFITDTHYDGPVVTHRARLGALFQWVIDRSDLDAFIIDGDIEYSSLTATTNSDRDSIFNALDIPFYIAPGNHDNYAYGVGDGTDWNVFTSRYRNLYGNWHSQADPGRRHAAIRIRDLSGNLTNVTCFLANTNAVDTVSTGVYAYTEANPTGGVSATDFDGIRGPSPQRTDLEWWATNMVQTDDWPIFVGHRGIQTTVTLEATTSSRDELDQALLPGGPANYLDSTIKQNWIGLFGDIHNIEFIDLYNSGSDSTGHYTFKNGHNYSQFRDINRSRFYMWDDFLTFAISADTTFSTLGTAITDSLGIKTTLKRGGSPIDYKWSFLTIIDFFAADTANVYGILFDQTGDGYTIVDVDTVATMQIVRTKVMNDNNLLNGHPGLARMKVTIDKDSVPSTLINFPVFIDPTDLGSTFFSTNASTHFFVTAQDEMTSLPFEIAGYDSSTQNGELYVLADSVSSYVDTDIYIYYMDMPYLNEVMNAAYKPVLQSYVTSKRINSPSTVWAGYDVVLHFNQTPSNGSSITNSAVAALNGIVVVASAADSTYSSTVLTKSYKSIHLNDNVPTTGRRSSMNIVDSDSLDYNGKSFSSLSIIRPVRTPMQYSNIFVKDNSSWATGYGFGYTSVADSLSFWTASYDADSVAVIAQALNTWQMWSTVHTAVSNTVYTGIIPDTDVRATSVTNNAFRLAFNNYSYGAGVTSALFYDEFRLADKVFSQAYVTATYNNYFNRSTFYSVLK